MEFNVIMFNVCLVIPENEKNEKTIFSFLGMQHIIAECSPCPWRQNLLWQQPTTQLTVLTQKVIPCLRRIAVKHCMLTPQICRTRTFKVVNKYQFVDVNP